jgi:hypothetical protein
MDKILKAADDIAAVFNVTQEWLEPGRSAVVKILKQLVEEKFTSTNTGSPKLPSFKESAEALSKRWPAGLTDGEGNLGGLAYFGAKAMYDFIVETCQLRAGA